jgi:predicted O-methyltransferase YrrM
MLATHYVSSDWFTNYGEEWAKHMSFPTVANGLEIGSYEGRSALWIMDNLLTAPGSVLRCVDTWDGTDPALGKLTQEAEQRFDSNTKKHQADRRIIKLKMSSYHALAWLIGAQLQFDLIYVDGDHNGLGALTDLLMAWPMLKPGGWLVFDDYNRQGDDLPVAVQPKHAWDAFVAMKPPGLTWFEHGRQVISKKER